MFTEDKKLGIDVHRLLISNDDSKYLSTPCVRLGKDGLERLYVLSYENSRLENDLSRSNLCVAFNVCLVISNNGTG